MTTKKTPPVAAGGNNQEIMSTTSNSTTDDAAQQFTALVSKIINQCSISATRYFSEREQERRWTINDILPQGQVTLLSGLGGTGKSLLSLQMIMHVLLNCDLFGSGIDAGDPVVTDLLGEEMHTEPPACLYVTAEDDSIEIHKRLRLLAQYFIEQGLVTEKEIMTLEQYNRLIVMTDDIVPQGYQNDFVALEHKQLRENFNWRVLNKIVEDTKPRVIVLDALTSLFPACSFNDMSQVQYVMGMCRKLTASGASVLILHHMTKGAYNALTFNHLTEACFGSIGILNRLRHALILWKDCLFIAKSNITQRRGWKLKFSSTGTSRAFTYDFPVLSDSGFDEMVKKLNSGQIVPPMEGEEEQTEEQGEGEKVSTATTPKRGRPRRKGVAGNDEAF